MQKASCAIMFADISGSTQMYDQLGDEAAKRTIDKCLSQLQIVTEALESGTEIPHTGKITRIDTMGKS